MELVGLELTEVCLNRDCNQTGSGHGLQGQFEDRRYMAELIYSDSDQDRTQSRTTDQAEDQTGHLWEDRGVVVFREVPVKQRSQPMTLNV